jgi:hypothetical protein
LRVDSYVEVQEESSIVFRSIGGKGITTSNMYSAIRRMNEQIVFQLASGMESL